MLSKTLTRESLASSSERRDSIRDWKEFMFERKALISFQQPDVQVPVSSVLGHLQEVSPTENLSQPTTEKGSSTEQHFPNVFLAALKHWEDESRIIAYRLTLHWLAGSVFSDDESPVVLCTTSNAVFNANEWSKSSEKEHYKRFDVTEASNKGVLVGRT
ncbi:unnamed protein product [Trichobilharzia regenti]|nr:unnamed protein product [Trichobilharzia regenti]